MTEPRRAEQPRRAEEPVEDVQHERALAAAASEIDHLRAALERRAVIGQAQGVLMERLGIDACQAFDYLKRTSNELNLKLYAVAAGIVHTRELPGDVRPGEGRHHHGTHPQQR